MASIDLLDQVVYTYVHSPCWSISCMVYQFFVCRGHTTQVCDESKCCSCELPFPSRWQEESSVVPLRLLIFPVELVQGAAHS